jgi:hypothetical protein
MPVRVRQTATVYGARALTLVLLAAFMLRALVPSGWMPHASSGGVTFIICTVAGLREVAVGPDGKVQPVDDTGQGPSDPGPCPFASMAKFAPPVLQASLAPSFALSGFVPAVRMVAAPAPTHLRLAESRAPPVA